MEIDLIGRSNASDMDPWSSGPCSGPEASAEADSRLVHRQ